MNRVTMLGTQNRSQSRFVRLGSVCLWILFPTGLTAGPSNLTSTKLPYGFGPATFAKELYLNHGAEFSNVRLVEVEMVNPGAFKLEVVKDGKVISVGTRDNQHGGWSTFDFSSGMVPPVWGSKSPYKLRFVNVSAGKREIKQGTISK